MSRSTDLARLTICGTTKKPNASSVSLTVLGQLWSMKNGKIMRRSGYPVKHPKARKFEEDFLAQTAVYRCSMKAEVLTGPLRAIVTVYYPSERQDLDCALVYDLLQKAELIQNDRQIIEKHEFRGTDKKNPRVEIIMEEL